MTMPSSQLLDQINWWLHVIQILLILLSAVLGYRAGYEKGCLTRDEINESRIDALEKLHKD